MAAPHLGGYPLLRTLGQGGFGEVYLSQDPWSGRQIALKRASDKEGAAERLLAEFSLHAQLILPEIPAPGRLGMLPDGQVYATMERLRGRGVMGAVRRAGPPGSPNRQRAAREILAGLLRSLTALHAARVLHCDLKTRNLFLHPSGAVRLLDLGAARRLDPRTNRSRPQRFTGTLRYASPEHRARMPLDVRADLFSAGALTVRLLTDDKPDWPPEPPPGVSGRLAEALDALLAINPNRRPANAREALELLDTPTVPARWWPGSAIVYVDAMRLRREQRARALAAAAGDGVLIQTHGDTLSTALVPLLTTTEPATLVIHELHNTTEKGRMALRRLLRRALRQNLTLHLRATASPEPALREELALAAFVPPPTPAHANIERILECIRRGYWRDALTACRGADPMLPGEQPAVRAAALCWAAMGQPGEAARLLRMLPPEVAQLDSRALAMDVPKAWSDALACGDLDAARRWLTQHELEEDPEALGGALMAAQPLFPED